LEKPIPKLSEIFCEGLKCYYPLLDTFAATSINIVDSGCHVVGIIYLRAASSFLSSQQEQAKKSRILMDNDLYNYTLALSGNYVTEFENGKGTWVNRDT